MLMRNQGHSKIDTKSTKHVKSKKSRMTASDFEMMSNKSRRCLAHKVNTQMQFMTLQQNQNQFSTLQQNLGSIEELELEDEGNLQHEE